MEETSSTTSGALSRSFTSARGAVSHSERERGAGSGVAVSWLSCFASKWRPLQCGDEQGSIDELFL